MHFLQFSQASVAHKNLLFIHSTLVAFAVRQLSLRWPVWVRGLQAFAQQDLVLMQRPLVELAFELEVASIGQGLGDFGYTGFGHDAGSSSSFGFQA